MGQAKLRGTFEERKAKAEKLAIEIFTLQAEIQRRRPSPKHSMMLAQLMALGLTNNPNFRI